VVSSNPAVTGFTNVSNLIVNPTSAVEQFQQIKRFVVDSPSSNILPVLGTIQWQISDNAAFANYSLIGSNFYINKRTNRAIDCDTIF
jgi:hypothetical protein